MTQPEFDQLPTTRPREIVTETSAEFFSICQREANGELVIESISRGKGNGQWIARVWYPKK